MVRYFFHIYDGEEHLDRDGTTLASKEEARAHAIIVAGELIRDAGKKRWRGSKWCLRVTDIANAPVCTLKLSVDDFSVN